MNSGWWQAAAAIAGAIGATALWMAVAAWLAPPDLTWDPILAHTDDVLDRPLPEIRSDGTFGEALDAVVTAAAEAGVEVTVEEGYGEGLFPWSGLDDASEFERPDQVLRIRLPHATLRQAMQTLTNASFGGSYWVEVPTTPDAPPRVIATYPMAERPPLVTRVYDVRDLMLFARRLHAAMFGAVPPPATPEGQRLDIELQQNLAKVAKLCNPGTWEYAGSGNPPAYGSVRHDHGFLRVRQTPEAHRRLEILFAALRASPAEVEANGWSAP